MIPSILIFILILSLLVFVHELGHFIMARKFGINVEEFGIGLPPRIWGKKIKGTIYSINLLTLGGFVKIKGEDFEGYNPKDKSNFINKKPWQKSLVLLAGIIMNLLLAVVIFYFILGLNGFKSAPILLLQDHNFPFGKAEPSPNVITFIESDSPAQKAGVQFADKIIKMSYKEDFVYPQNVDEVRAFVENKAGEKVILDTVNINSGDKNDYTVVPVYNGDLKQPALGIALSDAVILDYNTGVDRVFAGFLHGWNITGYAISVFGGMISASIQSRDAGIVAEGVSGPVGIFGVVRSVIESGGKRVVSTMFDLTAILSLSLGIMNLLPIPALDGGRLVFVVSEWITGKRPSQKLEARAHQIGYFLLLALLLLITVKDIRRL